MAPSGVLVSTPIFILRAFLTIHRACKQQPIHMPAGFLQAQSGQDREGRAKDWYAYTLRQRRRAEMVHGMASLVRFHIR
jgi:hypothetical protein